MNASRLNQKHNSNRKTVGQYFQEMRLASASQRPTILEDAKKAVTRAATKSIARKIQGRKSGKRASEAVSALPPMPLTPLAGDYNIWGATGLNGDGYSIEEPNNSVTESKTKKSKNCKACGSKSCDCVTYEQMKEAMERHATSYFNI